MLGRIEWDLAFQEFVSQKKLVPKRAPEFESLVLGTKNADEIYQTADWASLAAEKRAFSNTSAEIHSKTQMLGLPPSS